MGPRSIPIYECKPCIGIGKIYDTNQNADTFYQCVCDRANRFVTGGEDCFEENVADQITSNYREDPSILYTSVKIGTRFNQQFSVSRSDTFDYLYLKAAIGCKLNENIQDC